MKKIFGIRQGFGIRTSPSLPECLLLLKCLHSPTKAHVNDFNSEARLPELFLSVYHSPA